MTMRPIDVTALTDDGLDNLIENHRKQGAVDSPVYVEALAERTKRKGRGLEFDKSYQIIARAAKEGRFISYKDLADESGADWSRVHYSVGGHLWDLVEYAHRRGWPMLSAIVVNKTHIDTGTMEPETLKGFVSAARALGHSVVDEEAFLRLQQKLVFDWGSREAG